MDDKDLNSLSQTSKNNSKKVQGILLSRKYFKAIKTNNITNIKQMLSTEKGISFIIEKCKNKQENQKLWNLVITKNDIELLTQMKLLGIEMTLSENELIKIIISFRLVKYYETIEFLVDYLKEDLTDNTAHLLIDFLMWHLRTPNNNKQQKSQLEIIKNLLEFQRAKDWLNNNFNFVLRSLNIKLVDFLIEKLEIKINGLFGEITILQCIVVRYFIEDRSLIYDNLGFKMFEHLLLIGADVNRRDFDGNDVNYLINIIRNEKIKNTLNEIITKHKTSH